MALDVYFRDDIGRILAALAASSTETGEYARGYRTALGCVALAFGLIDAREANGHAGTATVQTAEQRHVRR